MPKEVSHCLSAVLIDSVFKMGKNYYPQVFLEELKYIFREKEVNGNIDRDIDISYDDSDESDKE